MKRETFETLIESIREGGEILRGDKKPSRVFKVRPSDSSSKIPDGFVMCVKTDDESLLIPCKIYHARFTTSGRIR
ncbi:MAG: hypothetical protein ABIU09_10950, partial [Pyrinomonadaceae bacterium]